MFEKVAHRFDEQDGLTLEDLIRLECVPHTQAAVALAFLKERGCVVVDRRRNWRSSGDVYLDAMIELTALHEAARRRAAR